MAELTILLAAVALAAAFTMLYPGLSLRSDYGICGGWFGSTVRVPSDATRSGASWSR